MTPSIDQTLHQFANLLPNWTLIPILTLLPNFGGFHRTLQRVRLANRGLLLFWTPGPVPFWTCICSNVETNLSWTCHIYGPFEFRTSLGTSILLYYIHVACDTDSQLPREMIYDPNMIHHFSIIQHATYTIESFIAINWRDVTLSVFVRNDFTCAYVSVVLQLLSKCCSLPFVFATARISKLTNCGVNCVPSGACDVKIGTFNVRACINIG